MSKYHVGKQAERQIARLFGAKRNWQAQAQGGADFKTDWLAVEVFVKEIPEFLKQELGQAIADNENRLLPIAIWHEKGKSYQEALVILRLKDWREWFG